MFFDRAFGTVPVMAILRGYDPAESVRLATAAWDIGVRCVEVPIQAPDALAALRAVVAAGRERELPVGSGTVVTVEQVEATIGAGGSFTVAPGFLPEVADESRRRGLPHLPGVATPSDIERALAAGMTWLKAFPASVLGTAWFTAMRSGPFPDVRFVATGGISARNARAFLDAGAAVVSVGSALADPTALASIAELLAARTPDEKEGAAR